MRVLVAVPLCDDLHKPVSYAGCFICSIVWNGWVLLLFSRVLAKTNWNEWVVRVGKAQVKPLNYGSVRGTRRVGPHFENAFYL